MHQNVLHNRREQTIGRESAKIRISAHRWRSDVHKNCVHRKSPKKRVDAVPCAARRRLTVRQSRSMAFRVSKVDLVVEMLVFPTNTRRGTWRMQPAVVPPKTTVMADVTMSLARSLHNGGKLEVERAALYAVALCCRWVEGRSRSGVPQEVRAVVPVTTSSPRLSFRARSSHCQVLAFPLTHGPEGGSRWCQITPGVPTSRSCEWNMQHNARVRKCGWRWKVASGVEDSSSEASFFTKRVPEPTMRTTPNAHPQ